MHKLKLELQHFFCDLFFCLRGSSVRKRYQDCTKFYFYCGSFDRYLKLQFSNIFLNMKKMPSSIFDQFENNDIKYFNMDLYYLLFRFLNVSPVDNFECVYIDAYNK